MESLVVLDHYLAYKGIEQLSISGWVIGRYKANSVLIQAVATLPDSTSFLTKSRELQMLLHFQSTHSTESSDDMVVNVDDKNGFEAFVCSNKKKTSEYIVRFSFYKCNVAEIHETEEKARESIADKLKKLGCEGVDELVAALNFRED